VPIPEGLAALAERVWYGDGPGAAAARAALSPLAWLYGAGVRSAQSAYDTGRRAPTATAIPALSVGNLSVGGTGKTPMAAWFAAELVALGARPALVLRGYGDDEPAVHRLLNADVPVVVSADRVAGCREAQRLGADVAVLDDAFQHRRAARVRDVVLVSADRWTGRWTMLPAGPFREPASALRRADLLVVTRKAASRDASSAVARALASVAPGVPVAHVALSLDAVHPVGGGPATPLAAWRGRAVLAVAGIGDPAAFAAQLSAAGLQPELRAFPDHHPYTDGDVAALVRDAGDRPIVCTLKDAVKLAGRRPGGTVSAWYVSQRVTVEDGAPHLSAVCTALLAARPSSPAT
jgi:tetraacyldisaccharide 4'-kinase